MKKLKVSMMLIAFTSVFIICLSSVPNVFGADLIYSGISVDYSSGDVYNAPSLSLSIQSITDPDNSGNNIVSPPVNDYFILKDSVVKLTGKMTSSGNVWSATPDLSGLPDGTYSVAFNFSTELLVDRGYHEVIDQDFTLNHGLLINYAVNFDEVEDKFSINFGKLESSYDDGDQVNESTVSSAKYHVEKNGRIVLSGDLLYEGGSYSVSDVSMSWKLGGEFYVWVEFNYNGVNYVTKIEDDTNPVHTFTRNAPMETFIVVISSIIGGVVVLLSIIIIRSRRGSARIEKRKIPKETGPIEVIDIKGKNIQKLDTTNISKKKQKGKTQVNKDLIFSVPQWEEDDLGDDSDVNDEFVTEEKAKSIEDISYSMHCAKCNSWFEIEKFVEIDCPKCDAPLSLAMYCKSEEKWFDVPKPGKYNCPTCGKGLTLSK